MINGFCAKFEQRDSMNVFGDQSVVRYFHCEPDEIEEKKRQVQEAARLAGMAVVFGSARVHCGPLDPGKLQAELQEEMERLLLKHHEEYVP